MSMINIGLSNALFSRVQGLVMALLLGHPERSFHTNEIIRLAQSGTGAVQRELAKLVAVGLITMRIIGNQKHYQANQNSPIFAELRSIILKTFGIGDVLKKALLAVSQQIRFAFIYGSIAKQTDHANSDIDLMLISDTLTYSDVFPLLAGVEEKLLRSVNPTIYTATTWSIKAHHRENNFLERVISQPKIFLLGSEDEFGQFGEDQKFEN